MRPVGQRIGAWLKADEHSVWLIGYGTFVGDEVPPKPMGLVASLFNASTWEEFDTASVAEIGRTVPHPTNPKLVMDDGTVVWGCECWWGPEEVLKSKVGGRTVIQVDMAAARSAAQAEVKP